MSWLHLWQDEVMSKQYKPLGLQIAQIKKI